MADEFVGDPGVPEVALEIKDANVGDDNGMWPEYCNPAYRMPNEIEVKIQSATGDYYFPVAIVKVNGNKPYLGGYRNKRSGQVYHHALTQTPTDSKKAVKVKMLSSTLNV